MHWSQLKRGEERAGEKHKYGKLKERSRDMNDRLRRPNIHITEMKKKSREICVLLRRGIKREWLRIFYSG